MQKFAYPSAVPAILQQDLKPVPEFLLKNSEEHIMIFQLVNSTKKQEIKWSNFSHLISCFSFYCTVVCVSGTETIVSI